MNASDGTTSTSDDASDGPLTLRLAVLGLWIEAVFAAGLTIFQLVEVFVASPSDPVMAVLLAGFTGALAVLLYRLGTLLTNRRVWPRGVAIVAQLLAVPVAYFMITGEGDLPVKVGGVALGVYCLVCAGLLLAPSSRLALLKPDRQAAER